MSIEETEVDFNLDRPLTKEELALTIKYCKHDVDATEKVTDIRKNYLNNKVYLGGLKSIEPTKALAMTNAKLTAAYLDARREIEFNDERKYKYPENLRREYIPKEVFDFFDKLKDPSISDEDVFKGKYKFQMDDGECVLGFGGIHMGIPNYMEVSDE